MNCKKYIDLLPLYAIGDLDYVEQDEVKAHLETCEHCREELKQVSEVVSILTSSDMETMTELEKLKLENKIYHKLTREKIKRQGVKGFRITPVILQVAAAIILFFLGFGIKSVLTQPETQKQEYENTQVMLTSLEKIGNQCSAASGMRFTEAGFKFIARGKSSEKIELKND